MFLPHRRTELFFATSVLAVAFGCALAIAVLGAWICATGAPKIRGSELNVILTIQKALAGRSIFTNLNETPFDIAQYGPLYYAMCAGLARILGIVPDDAARLLLLCRGVSCACATLMVVGGYGVAKWLFGLRKAYSIVVVAFVFVATSPWLFLARPDAMMCLLMMSSFTLVVVAALRQSAVSYWCLLAAVICAMAATFTKQNGIQAVAIAPLYLMLIRQWRKAIACLMAIVVIGVASWSVATFIFPHLVPNMIGGVNNGVSVRQIAGNTYSVIFSNFALVMGMALLSVIYWGRGRDVRGSFFVVSLPILFLFAIITGLKIGSAEGYFNEFLIVAAISAGCLVQSHAPAGSMPNVRDARGIMLAILAAYVICFLPYWTVAQIGRYWRGRIDPAVSWWMPEGSLWNAKYYGVCKQLRSQLSSNPTARVLSFDKGVCSKIPERCVVPQTDVAEVLQKRKVADYSEFRRLVATGQIKYVVMRGNASLPTTFLDAPLRASYAWDSKVGAFDLYHWREPSLAKPASRNADLKVKTSERVEE